MDSAQLIVLAKLRGNVYEGEAVPTTPVQILT